MIGKDFLITFAFYLPFLFTLLFIVFLLFLGIVAFFSGTLFVVGLAVYGLYAMTRDMGIFHGLRTTIESLQTSFQNGFLTHLKQSFVLKQTEKIPTKPALYICEPHGLLGYSWILHFCYKIQDWPSSSPRPVLAAHSLLFRIPFVKEILEAFQFVDSSETTIKKYLEQGHSVAILIGGIEEMIYNGEEPVQLILKKRKGYARIAKEMGVPLVPLFTKGENELFPSVSFWPWRFFCQVCYKLTGVHFPLPSWNSIHRWTTLYRKPFDTPVETFVLDCIETQDKSESQIRKETIKCFFNFFKDQKIDAIFKA